MSYSEFSTPRADYVLQLEFHGENYQGIKIFKDCDAIAIEGVVSKEVNSAKELIDFCEFGDHGKLVDLMKRKRAKIFNLDISRIDGLLCFEYCKRIILDFINIPSSFLINYEARNSEKIRPISKALISTTTFLDQDYIGAFRNSVTAKKLEEFVAPKLQEELGRKPRIGMIYGAGHTGLEADIRYAWRRNFTLTNYRYFDPLRKFRCNIDTILEIDFSSDGQLKRYNFPIFSRKTLEESGGKA